MTPDGHMCVYRTRLVPGAWQDTGAVRRRSLTPTPTCQACGAVQPARKVRQPRYIEVEASADPSLPPSTPQLQLAAVALAQKGRPRFPAKGWFSLLRSKGVAQSTAQDLLDTFVRSGWVRITQLAMGSRTPYHAIEVLQLEALQEFAQPGERARREAALKAARDVVQGLRHPVAEFIRQLLDSEDLGEMGALELKALAGVAQHVETGDVLSLRSFSARYLEDSKSYKKVQRPLERVLGPLDALGIRQGDSLTSVGGVGSLEWSSSSLDLAAFPPFIGLSRETIASLDGIRFPAGGLLVVENIDPFEACCRGLIEYSGNALIVWTHGQPGNSVRRLVELADQADTRITVWADLDLYGIGIFRLIQSWATKEVRALRMSPADVQGAPRRLDLPPAQAHAIAKNLQRQPNAPLAPTLEALLKSGTWVEQEAFLGAIRARP